MGINSRAQLAQAEQIIQARLRQNLLEVGRDDAAAGDEFIWGWT